MDENEIQRLMQDNYKYIRVLREIVMADIGSFNDYKQMTHAIQQSASETVGEFEVNKVD